MRRSARPRILSGAKRLAVTDDIFTFIRGIVRAGVRDTLGPRATKKHIEEELLRRLSL